MNNDSTRQPDENASLPDDADDGADAARPSNGAFPVVGIGASAGGLEAFIELLKHLPTDTGMAFVLIQHLDPKHDSRLVELLAKVTELPVQAATEGLEVAPDQVYVIPPDTNLGLVDGSLCLTPRNESRGQHLPIDYFFRSLADDRHAAAVGVVLSGTGSDGTLGLSEIKAAGGLTFAQDQQSAKYDGMPKSAAHSGAVDFIRPPQEIARELARLGRHPYLVPAEETEAPPPGQEEPLRKILRLLRQAFGVDFSLYRKTTIRRRIMRRMVLQPADTLADYARHLERNRGELEALYEDILINVTSFFRDPEMFEELAASVFPEILETKPAGQPIRVWTAGCSTGQEAYSVAIALSEFLDDKPGAPDIQIFATDLSDAVSLVKARAGHYPDSIEGEVSPERLRRFFRKENGGYRVVKSIRDLCVFAKQNIAEDPPFSRLDLISCRNVLIYLSAPLQKRIVPTFHYALNPSGFLLLGSSETVGGFSDLFATVDKHHKIYARKATTQRVYPHFSADRYVSRVATDKDAIQPPPGLIDWQKEADRVVVGRYAPVGVLVNDRLDVLQFRGRTSAYLEPASGEASFNLLKMAREGLFGELRTGIAEAREKNAPVERKGIRVRGDGPARLVDLHIVPLHLSGTKDACFLVLFEEPCPAEGRDGMKPRQEAPRKATPPPVTTLRRRFDKLLPGAAGRAGDPEANRAPGDGAAPPDSDEIEQLRRELTATRDHQQSILEQQEAANEELRSANEEVLSSNEELQSTNEELETAKEELQSLNEELTTVNEQLQNRNQELNLANNDLTNFFGSTQIPLVMLGSDLKLRRFTPAAEKSFNLHGADVGRPLADIRFVVDVPDLERLVVETQDTMQLREQEVRDREGRWHLLRIRPYRTVDNKIEGSVVALLDIDDIKRSEQRMEEVADYAKAIVGTVREPLLVLDSDLRVQSTNESFYQTFKVKADETENRLLYELGDGQWDIPELRSLLEEILPRDKSVEDYEVEHDFPGVGPRTMLLNARGLQQKEGKTQLILLALEDVTERQRLRREQKTLLAREQEANEKLRKSEGRYHHLVGNLPAAVYTCDAEGRVTFFNDTAAALWGREPQIGKDLWCGSWRIYNADGTEMPLDTCPMAIAIKEGRAVNGEIVIERPDGSRLDVLAHATPIFDASGAVTGAINLLMDNTERKLSEKTRADFAAIVESSDDAIVSKDLDGVVQSWNPGAERTFGYSAEEMIGQPIMRIVPPELRNEEQEILNNLRRGERVEHLQTVRVAKDGRRLDVSLTISPVRNASGQVVGASKIARDISDMKRTAQALKDADRRKDEFLAMLAHELRNPLSAVASAVELLGTPGGAKHLDAGRKIIGRQTTHLVRLVDDLLDMSRITRGIVTLRKEALDAASVIRRAAETVRPLMSERRHDLKVSLPKKPLWLEGDATRLEQVVANLLTNSAKYTEPGGRIEVKAKRQGDSIAITVRDNGIGISAEQLPEVFELFSQSERSAERAAGGLGIGLTLVRSIVELHGGSVEGKSDGLRQGSEFTVRLPALAEDDKRKRPLRHTAPAVDGLPARRILVVDDNEDAALALSGVLEASGHTVHQAFDGPSSLDAAALHRPHAILLDIGLPGLNGFEVAKRLRQDPDLSHILLIAISGYCQEEDRQRSREAGFDHHLAKPTDHRELLALLAETPSTDPDQA